MWKKVLFTLAILAAVPTGLANCAATGSGSIGEEGAAGSASGRVGEGSSSTSTSGDTDD